jgi:Fatty acid hydroxylase superfamily
MTVVRTALAQLALVGAGWFAWTLGEYVLHRFAMHELRGRGYPSKEHLLHHASNETRLTSWILSWIGIALTGALMGWVLAPVFGLGWVVGYTYYELQHHWAHRRAPRNAYQRFLRKHHFHHHFGHPMANQGVTVPVWDWVFGTYEPVATVRVPRRMAMPWLLDDDGEVRAEHRGDYELAGRLPGTDEQVARDHTDAFANRAPAV